LEDTGVCGR